MLIDDIEIPATKSSVGAEGEGLASNIHKGDSPLGNVIDYKLLKNENSQTPAPSAPPLADSFHNNSKYEGDVIDESAPLHDGEFAALDFKSPAELVCFFDKYLRDGATTLHPWQIEVNEELVAPNATQQSPIKYCLCAANGSGKDQFVIAPFAVWFILCKIRARCIITSSSGSQLTAQTESYIKDLAQKVNNHFGEEIFRIRQRYIKCRLSGSEIRMFATDEAGKAEGYHPMQPNAAMAIIPNEAKSIPEDIFDALERCTGFTHWLEVSSAGNASGHFYDSFEQWEHTRRVTSYDCPHLSESEREADRVRHGEHSAWFRSKHLALFTSIGGNIIISPELIAKIEKKLPNEAFQDWEARVGIDLAAGGDETSLTKCKGNKTVVRKDFTEKDTTLAADLIDLTLKSWDIDKLSEFIFADDGGVGHAIIDMLVRMGWNIKRIRNQSPSSNKKLYGNKGAENWYAVAKLLEQGFIIPPVDDKKLIKQLVDRRYKQGDGSGNSKIYLESKKAAKAHGRPSPDRADSWILAHVGLSVDDFLQEDNSKKVTKRPDVQSFNSAEEAVRYIEEQMYKNFDHNTSGSKGRANGSLQVAMNN